MIEEINPAILLGWAVAALLLALSLWTAVAGQLRRGAHAGFAGVAVLVAVTLYSLDVMAMPQICGALLAGGALGLLMERGVPKSAMPALLAALVGQTGMAALLLVAGAWRNPHAFGLLDDATDALVQGAAVTMGLAAAFGAMAGAGTMTILWRVMARPVRSLMHLLFSAMALALVGGVLWAFARDPQLALLGGCAGVGLMAGPALARWALATGPGPALALTGGMAGWAVAASAFLLENMGVAVAGGLAGAAGSLFALRLCRGAGGKGLADGGHHP